jgi:hypothetical protein
VEVRRLVWGYVLASGKMEVVNAVWNVERWASMGTGMDEVAFGDALRCGVEKGCDMAVLRTCLRV